MIRKRMAKITVRQISTTWGGNVRETKKDGRDGGRLAQLEMKTYIRGGLIQQRSKLVKIGQKL